MKTQIMLGDELGYVVKSFIRGRDAIGWFTTKNNKTYGYTLYDLLREEKQWLHLIDIPTQNVYRIHIEHRKAQGFVQIDWNRLSVRFLLTKGDYAEEYYEFSDSLPMLKLEVSTGYDLHRTLGIIKKG